MGRQPATLPYQDAADRQIPLERVRNIGIMAHIDAGKTTLSERILFYTGVNYRMGEVHEGTATMDYLEQEQERGITIKSAATTCFWQDHRINLIDTPGHVDFTAEVERSLRVLDGAVAVFCAVGGVQPQSETVWRQARKYGIPVVAFVNKMDRIGASFERVVAEMRDKLGIVAVPVILPLGDENRFVGVLDVLSDRALVYDRGGTGAEFSVEPVPCECQVAVEAARNYLIECLAEVDDVVLAAFLNDGPIDGQALRAALRRATLAGLVVPVTCGSAFRNKAVQTLLDAVVDYLPSPVDVWDVKATDVLTGEPLRRQIGDQQPFAALAFKVVNDGFLGNLVYFRVYSGTAVQGATVLNPRTGKTERFVRLLQMHANRREQREKVYCGDIAAAVGLQDVTTGDTLCEPKVPILLESVVFPEPVVAMAIEPKSADDRARLVEALAILVQEDPTFRVRIEPETGQTVIVAMGELHLEIIRDRLARQFAVQANVGKPQVAYRERLRGPGQAEVKFVRQVAGRGQYAHVALVLTPMAAGHGVTIERQLGGGVIPKDFLPAIEAGIREVADSGVLAGYPLVDLRVVITDGSHHPVESTELAFKVAAATAFKQAATEAGIVLMEPVMRVEVTVPEEHLGEVIGDLASRRGQVVEVDSTGLVVVVVGNVPLAGLFGYATALRSLTRGRADFAAEPSHFSDLGEAMQAEIISRR